MEEQPTKQKATRRERFPGEMEQAVPWARLVALIEPFSPRGERGRPPLGVELMLEKHDLPRRLFAGINALLSERGQEPSQNA